jgi:hypothetical protein
LLGVHSLHLAGRNPEEAWIELINLLYEATPSGTHFSGCTWLRVIEGVYVPPIFWHLGDRIHTITQKLPERFGIFGSGKTTTNADNCYGFHFKASNYKYFC